jgi:hypothetical protein
VCGTYLKKTITENIENRRKPVPTIITKVLKGTTPPIPQQLPDVSTYILV